METATKRLTERYEHEMAAAERRAYEDS